MDAQLYNQFSTFRFIALLMLAFSSAVVHLTAAEPAKEKNPDAVYVAVEQARVYAGPSSDFYPTGSVKRGTVLEVYHRTQNGWLGVRPPQGSFSWVPASQAYLLPGGNVIEITDANSVSWIGTELGSAKQYRWQVQLKVGEQLMVLGEASIKNDTDDREALWYKVSPPAGEFRWIEQAAVSKTAPEVSPTRVLTDSQVATKASESKSAESKSAESNSVGTQKNASESNKVVANKNETEKAIVQTASFERPTAQPPRSTNRLAANSSKSKAGNSNIANAKLKPTPPGNEWDGWYAFEMSEQGVRTPFLDKLSGRDRGQSPLPPRASAGKHDPLIHDPFSLSMADEVQKPQSDELNDVARKQRDWRDPRDLRAARLAGSTPSSLGSMASRRGNTTVSDFPASSPSNSSSVLPVSSDNYQNFGNNNAVNTAGYDRNEVQPMDTIPSDARMNVNWYGLCEQSSSNAQNTAAGSAQSSAPSNSMIVVTSTDDVGELQLALNNAVASSNGPWNLAPLAERARYFIEHGETAVDRGQARLLLERIEAFQSVSARAQQFNGPTPLQSSPVQSTSFNAATQNLSLPNATQAEKQSISANYEATGWLVPVHAAGPDQPTHALTNDTGDVVAYVSPIAGLNLDRYRNQAVGINGLRGYLPKLQAAHIQAQRVSRVR